MASFICGLFPTSSQQHIFGVGRVFSVRAVAFCMGDGRDRTQNHEKILKRWPQKKQGLNYMDWTRLEVILETIFRK